MDNKPEICGCHKGCTTEEHTCEKPCQWPNCLTKVELAELLKCLEGEA